MRAEEARERFAAARVARLATVDSTGRPHLVPITFALEGEHVYSAVDAKPKRTVALRRLENVRQNPRVALLVDRYEEDWEALWWVRADGSARVLEPDVEEAAIACRLLADRYPLFVPAGAVLAVDVERWSGWSSQSLD